MTEWDIGVMVPASRRKAANSHSFKAMNRFAQCQDNVTEWDIGVMVLDSRRNAANSHSFKPIYWFARSVRVM